LHEKKNYNLECFPLLHSRTPEPNPKSNK